MLCRAWQREVFIYPPAPGRGGNAFSPQGRRTAACVQPLRGELSQRLYGLEAEHMRLMLCGLCGEPRAGDGVCVEAAQGEPPDFRVVYAARWPGHWEAHLRRIPEAERGADK